MPDILPPEFQGTFREQLYAAKQWLDQYKMLLTEQLRQYELMYAQTGVNQQTTETIKINRINRKTNYNVSTEYEIWDYWLYDEPAIRPGNGLWFVQRHGNNKYVPTALETYGVIGSDVSAGGIYSAIEQWLPHKYSSSPIEMRASTGNGFILLGGMNAEETEQGDNEEEENGTE